MCGSDIPPITQAECLRLQKKGARGAPVSIFRLTFHAGRASISSFAISAVLTV